ncbi:ATP-binding cassette domain-containing protein [Pyrobaculum ferrireducens]|uniref:ABC transporter ATP-binding protein, putative n=1 Tax=Pyrobaculum ferrireducens TaxID=1104324 RepID=G7VCR5_9CREN|nr:ATP-binding cassette domain-containing protein [Pyrobaculum ferrireducens]AET33870.1 ABC transporter ATP-binding protein, putative [Pyrobaculum ferrireducens]
MALSVRGLRARRGRFELFVESLAVNSVVVLLGRNGSGKTTLLDAIAGVIPAEGVVEACGRDVSALPPEERRLVYIQATPVDPPAKAGKFLRAVAARWGRDRRAVLEVAERLGIRHLLEASSMSTGQKQLVNIAAGLLADPCAFLMDEPASHLDWFNKRLVNNVVRKLDKPVLYVTHDPIEAAYVGDRICVVEQGRLTKCVDNPGVKTDDVDRFVEALFS